MSEHVHPDKIIGMWIDRVDNPRSGRATINIMIQCSTQDVADILSNAINQALQKEGGLRFGGTNTGSVTIRTSKIIEGSKS
jgi:hypothetical protein